MGLRSGRIAVWRAPIGWVEVGREVGPRPSHEAVTQLVESDGPPHARIRITDSKDGGSAIAGAVDGDDGVARRQRVRGSADEFLELRRARLRSEEHTSELQSLA